MSTTFKRHARVTFRARHDRPQRAGKVVATTETPAAPSSPSRTTPAPR